MGVAGANGLQYARLAGALDRLGQRHVGGDVDARQLVGDQQHERRRRPHQMLQQPGVAVVTVPGQVQRRLVERCGDDHRDLVGLGHLHGADHVAVSRMAAAGRDLAIANAVVLGRLDGDHAHPAVAKIKVGAGKRARPRQRIRVANDQALAAPLRRQRRQRLANNFRADPAGVAHGNGDRFQG